MAIGNTKRSSRHGAPWKAEEDRQLYDGFSAGKVVAELCVIHGRSAGGIRARLRCLGLIDEFFQPVIPVPEFKCRRTESASSLKPQGPADDISYEAPEAPLLGEESLEALRQNVERRYGSASVRDLRHHRAISQRLTNRLGLLGIDNIDDAARLTAKQCLRTPGFGRRTLRELKAFLSSFAVHTAAPAQEVSAPVQEPPPAIPVVQWNWSEDTVVQLLEFLFTLSQTLHNKRSRDLELFLYRLGLDARFPDGLKLQDLALLYGFSRERARQIFERYNLSFRRYLRRTPVCSQFRRDVHEFFSLDNAVMPEKSVAEFCIEYFSAIQAPLFTEFLLTALEPATRRYDAKEVYSTVLAELRKNKWLQRRQESLQRKQERLCEKWHCIIDVSNTNGALGHFSGTLPCIVGAQRKPNEDSIGQVGSFYSQKCQREVFYESMAEYAVLKDLEVLDSVISYQEQPVYIPYELDGQRRRYYPDIAVLTARGHGLLIEVKPRINMVQRITLVKALAAMRWAAEHGMAYMMVDRTGRDLAHFANCVVPSEVTHAVLGIIEREGTVGLDAYRWLRKNRGLRFDQLLSIVIRHDLSLDWVPFRLSKLEQAYSFRPMLNRLSAGLHVDSAGVNLR